MVRLYDCKTKSVSVCARVRKQNESVRSS